MTRPLLDPAAVSPRVATAQARFHADVVAEVAQAVATHDVVVVGMKWNPHVPKARKALAEAGIDHHYLEYGSYVSMWKPRLAIKMWSGWPTFPQVFVKGQLVGGHSDVRKQLDDGSLRALLAAPRPV
ncbi:MAG: glutaredoxin [Alphaproteobacteria bacterium]|nr:glutaredoxin [Alphaproteobacteria bacterium]